MQEEVEEALELLWSNEDLLRRPGTQFQFVRENFSDDKWPFQTAQNIVYADYVFLLEELKNKKVRCPLYTWRNGQTTFFTISGIFETFLSISMSLSLSCFQLHVYCFAKASKCGNGTLEHAIGTFKEWMLYIYISMTDSK